MPLYKYLTPERTDVVLNARIRFTQPNSLNDPFELKPFFKVVLDPKTIEQRIREKMDLRPALFKKYNSLPREIRKRVSAESFVNQALAEMERRKPELDALFDEEMTSLEAMQPQLGEMFRSMMHRYFGEEIGILSLSEDPLNDLMWAHYAKDHSGFVVEFDESSEFFNRKRSDGDEFFHLRKVSYVDRPLNSTSFEELIGSDLFASKLSKWAYEREWRMLVPLTGREPEIRNACDQIHLIAIPKNSIKSITFGMRSKPDLRATLGRILKNDAAYDVVELKEAYLDLENGRIDIRPTPK